MKGQLKVNTRLTFDLCVIKTNVQPDDFVFLRYGQPIRKHLAEKWFGRALVEAVKPAAGAANRLFE